MIRKFFHLLIAIPLLLTSCSLEEEPRDQIPEEEAYTSAKDIFRNSVAALYSYVGGYQDGQGLQGTCRGIYDLQTFGSDEAMLPTRGADWYDGEIWQHMYRHSWSASHDLPKNSWLYLYKVITLCNNSLKQIEDHKKLLSVQQLQEYTAEVRALRAIYYWYLMDLFGRVPIITSCDMSIYEVKQSERSEVFRFILTELDETYDHLSVENSAQRGDYYGRVTKPVACFVLAKLMLNAEVYADDNWTDGKRPKGSDIIFNIEGKDLNAWEATIYFCNILSDLGYRLEDNYQNNFKVRNEYSIENIWTISMDKDLYPNQQQNLFRSYHYRHAAAYGFSGENGSCATVKTLKVFGYDTDSVDTRFDMNYWAGEVYDLNNKVITDRTGAPLVYWPWQLQLEFANDKYAETAGARMKKYEIDKNAMADGKLMDNDIVLFRYADVLLMRAEAELRNGNPTAGQKDFDAVRMRVNMKTRQISLKNLLDERLLELCWEGWRRQDLIRFGQYESLFEGSLFDPKVDESNGFTTVYPIPADVIALNHNLKQNEGY